MTDTCYWCPIGSCEGDCQPGSCIGCNWCVGKGKSRYKIRNQVILHSNVMLCTVFMKLKLSFRFTAKCYTKDDFEACHFPFKYQGSTFWACTEYGWGCGAPGDLCKGYPWCATKVDNNGVMVKGKWGYCNYESYRRCFDGKNGSLK